MIRKDPARVFDELRETVKEHSDVVQKLLGTYLDEATLRDALTEISEARAALERLHGAVNRQLQKTVE